MNDLAQVLEEQLALPIARNKTVVAATDRDLAGRLAEQLQQVGAKAEEAPTGLGTRYALKPTGGLALQAKRWGKFARRMRRLQTLAKGRKAGKRPGFMLRALAAGPLYGTAVAPLAPARLRTLRT